MTAIDVTDENFEQILHSGKTVLIDFGAEWCPPCKAMTPVIDFIADGILATTSNTIGKMEKS